MGGPRGLSSCGASCAELGAVCRSGTGEPPLVALGAPSGGSSFGPSGRSTFQGRITGVLRCSGSLTREPVSSPRRPKETTRRNDVNTNVRDLADPTLWERSLERARHRRHIAELSRRHARRRKATSVAVAGAVVTSPVTPLLSVGGAPSEAVAAGGPLEPTHASSVLLRRGSVGEAVE